MVMLPDILNRLISPSTRSPDAFSDLSLPPAIFEQGSSSNVSQATGGEYAQNLVKQVKAGKPVPGAVARICEELGPETPAGLDALRGLAQVRYALAMDALSRHRAPTHWVSAQVPPLPRA